jgi:hypothetical protein
MTSFMWTMFNKGLQTDKETSLNELLDCRTLHRNSFRSPPRRLPRPHHLAAVLASHPVMVQQKVCRNRKEATMRQAVVEALAVEGLRAVVVARRAGAREGNVVGEEEGEGPKKTRQLASKAWDKTADLGEIPGQNLGHPYAEKQDPHNRIWSCLRGWVS